MKPTMQPGVFYRVRQAGNDVFINGHFYNGRFYQGRHFIGQVDDNGAFRYFEDQDNDRSTIPEHIVGYVDGLVLIFNDGTLFNLVEVDRLGGAMIAADEARHRLNDGLQAWTNRWGVVNGVLICVKCGARQRPSEADIPFSHVFNCAQRDDPAHCWPWQELTALLAELPAAAVP